LKMSVKLFGSIGLIMEFEISVSIDVIEVLVIAMIMDIHICAICFKIRLIPKIGLSTRMHCNYQNFDNIY